MGASRNINTYHDVRKLLDIAVVRKGLRYRLKSPGAAIHIRQRINMFRRLAHEQAVASAILPGASPETPYDNLTTVLDGCDVVISLQDLEGEVLDLDETPVEDLPDDLEEEVERFKKQLMGDGDD